jgi:multidrug efflux pump subunit AcrA (membrane-fusion protein)
MAAAAVGVVVAVALVRGLWPRQEAPRQRPPVPVDLATARVGAISVTYPITGEVRAVASAQIRPEVSGILERVYFREGQEVRAGQPLLGLDRAPFLAALNQAIANRRKAAAAVQVAAAKARSAHTLARTSRLRADSAPMTTATRARPSRRTEVARLNPAARVKPVLMPSAPSIMSIARLCPVKI